jgi:hypothetical protein
MMEPMPSIVRNRLRALMALAALGFVVAHEGHLVAPHHADGEDHCCLCDAATGITPTAVPILCPDLAMAPTVIAETRPVAALRLHADASRAPPSV